MCDVLIYLFFTFSRHCSVSCCLNGQRVNFDKKDEKIDERGGAQYNKKASEWQTLGKLFWINEALTTAKD